MSEPAEGLRRRKMLASRLAIRRAAFRLFGEQGYTNTTVDQIAEAANVSPRTFYRYFGVKEGVLLCDQTEPVVEAFIDAPAELSPVAAYRYAVDAYFAGLTEEEREDAIIGQHLLYSVPEAFGLLYSEYVKLIELMADALAVRLPEPGTTVERRVIAGAIVGVLIAFSDNSPLPEDALMSGLDVLEARLD
jgi:AcrR family transcriptional regulator